jgi:hypothetical protein
MAKADSSEMTILPTAMATAITALLNSIRPILARCHASA